MTKPSDRLTRIRAGGPIVTADAEWLLGEVERLKKALDCWHDEYCGCAEGIANHRDLKLARVASSDEPESQE